MVSVIITSYNYGGYIEEAISSIFNQSYSDIEIIIVDDGSTDNTSDIIKTKYADRVHYIYRDNGGAAAARNTGLKYANGEYICFLDADDLLMPNAIEGHLTYLKNNENVDLVCANVQYIGLLSGVARPTIYGKGDRELTYIDMVADNLVGGPHSVMLRRRVFDICGIFNESFRVREDYEYWLRCSYRCKLIYRDDIVAEYRIHGFNKTESQSRGNEQEKRILQLQLLLDLSDDEKRAVNAELTYHAIRDSWREGRGKKARKMIRK